MSQVSTALDNLGDNEKNLVAFAAGLTQRQCRNGEIAFKNGQKYTPTVADTYELVNDDPAHPLTSAMGAEADSLHYKRDSLLILVWEAQDAEGVARNKSQDIFNAAVSGNYSGIRGA
jgi:hypothetical protein